MRTDRTLWWAAAVLAPLLVVAGEIGFFMNGTTPIETIPLDITVGALSMVVGLVLWHRFTDNRTGWLLYLAGALWAIPGIRSIGDPILFGIGEALAGAQDVVFAHLLLAYPGGTLQTRPARLTVCLAYTLIPLNLVRAMVLGPQACDCALPENGLLVVDSPTVHQALGDVGLVIAIVVIVGAIAVLINRWWRAGPVGRRVFGPVLVSAVVLAMAILAQELSDGPEGTPQEVVLVAVVARILVPIAFLWGLMQTTLDRAALGGLFVGLDRVGPDRRIESVLAASLHDPGIRLAFWIDDPAGYVDSDGVPFDVSPGATRAVTLLEGGGRRLGALIHHPALLRDPMTIEAAVTATRMVIERERLQAQVRAQLEEVRASRARIVEATETERRRIERDLHDGAQQRLLALLLELRLIREQTTDPSIAQSLIEAEEDAREALVELRDLAQGIYPAILTSEGLGPAIELLAERAPLAVEVEVGAGRYPSAVETAVYFVVSEALANVIKHSEAETAWVQVSLLMGRLNLEVGDDGRGVGHVEDASGLRGMADRVAACDGEFHFVSEPGEGTRILASFPVDP